MPTLYDKTSGGQHVLRKMDLITLILNVCKTCGVVLTRAFLRVVEKY